MACCYAIITTMYAVTIDLIILGVVALCVFISKGLIYFHVQLPQQYLHLELLCIDILCNYYKHRLICVYRPPSYDAKQTCDLIDCLNFLCEVNFIVTVCDDFNFPNIDWQLILIFLLCPCMLLTSHILLYTMV